MSSISDTQKEKLIQFRKNVSDVLKQEHDDMYLLRWLRARNFDLARSETMLRDHLKWRVIVKADEILTNWTPPPVLLKHYPGNLHGYDKKGNPIWIEPVGRSDIKGIMASVKKSDLMKYKIWQCELIQKTLHDQFIKLQTNVAMILIVDLEGLSRKHLWKPALDFHTETLKTLEANYPETMGHIFIFNAPGIFPFGYSLAKPFISEDTRRKVHILGGNWKQELLKCIDADQLPVHWGGTATNPDGNPFCQSKIVMGGKVDPQFYIQEDYSCVDHDTFTKVTIGRRACLRLPFQVTDSGSLLRWQFITDSSDIGFGITYKAILDNGHSEVKEEVVVPSGRLNSHMVPEDGSITCQEPGLYIVTFDNSYSWVKSKRLLYQIDVLPPADDIDELKKSASYCASLSDEKPS